MGKIQKTWVIGDTHFFHHNIKFYTHRPDYFNELIVYNWVRLVGSQDYIIHLGDVGFGRFDRMKHVFDRLPGQKILVRGNHDRWTKRKYRELGFIDIVDDIKLGMFGHTVLMTHRPVDYIDDWAGIINVHGHIHNRSHDELWKVNASVELHDYGPVHLASLVKKRVDLINAFELWHR